ncbi:putative uncharacterized protein DDB_G0284695 [Protopterus annectens]|uniref:putative uncharacterized protein DDB_G0284695 n=1 Tax=Protopterus annectens TaxID=7888 RepID=UPI001CFA1D31|nr:putative uncharacterized protein DDB_G0284695 [Protopterus annectens]
MFDRQGTEFINRLIMHYNTEIGDLKADLEILEFTIKTHEEFPRYKYDYARIFSSIDATIAKLVANKKKKIARDVSDYTNNKAYPKPPAFHPRNPALSNQTHSLMDFNDIEQDVNVGEIHDNALDVPQTQLPRRSERINSNRNNRNMETANGNNQQPNANNSNNNNNTNQYNNHENNANTGSQGFHRGPNGLQNNYQPQKKQYIQKNKRKQRKR